MNPLTVLVRGVPGHPIHPPLTDATIGGYTFATVAAIGSVLGIAEHSTAKAWWLALVVSLVISVFTALTGFLERLQITRGTALWRTATTHFIAMVCATVVFLAAALTGHAGYVDGAVRTVPFVLTLVGYGLLSLGGWLGGKIVFVYGMRVLDDDQQAE